jgi:hypothetical protein
VLYPSIYGNNPLFPQAQDFKIVPKDDNSGQGVITFKDIKAGELIAHVFGEIVKKIGQHTLQISKNRHLYDPFFTGYLLHSCSPNVSLNMKKFTLTACANISANSFLYMDYAETEDKLFKQFFCSCGSSNCRGIITGRKESPNIQTSNIIQNDSAMINEY